MHFKVGSRNSMATFKTKPYATTVNNSPKNTFPETFHIEAFSN